MTIDLYNEKLTLPELQRIVARILDWLELEVHRRPDDPTPTATVEAFESLVSEPEILARAACFNAFHIAMDKRDAYRSAYPSQGSGET